MLYGRRLDEALEHVDGSRYALVHAVSKRARQITLWLTADPAELRAESAPPPAAGELVTRDPVALSEAEMLAGEVRVKWDPDGTAESTDIEVGGYQDDELLLDAIDDEDEIELVSTRDKGITPALSEALDADAGADADVEEAEAEAEEPDEDTDELAPASLEDLAERELEDDEDEDLDE